jgi:23S rRNA (uracil1939-C5)-methyltransferase
MTVIKAHDAVYGGFVLSRQDEGIVFVRGAVPGEVVEVEIEEKKRDYTIARVIDVVEKSEHRIEPHCQYFGECGGCHLQFIKYDMQAQMKDDILLDCLKRIGRIEMELEPRLTGKDFGYRHRAQFKVSKEGEVGFFKEGTIEVIPVSQCPLLVDPINEALEKLRAINLQGIKEIHITSGDIVQVMLKGKGYDEAFADKIIALGISGVTFDDGTYRGSGQSYIMLDLNGLKYTVSPKSFFQSNWDLNLELSKLIVDEIGPMTDKRLLDLYAGAGNFSLHLAQDAAETIAIEDNASSIKDGTRNRSANRISKLHFVKNRAETVALDGEFDVLLIDPPRSGVSKGAMKKVQKLMPQRIVYVSCNPSTFSRDLRKLSDLYDIDSIRMVDMFPNTYHLESIAFLTLKDNIEEILALKEKEKEEAQKEKTKDKK